RFETAIDAESGDIAVGTAEGAVARRGERVREAGLGDEPGGLAEDAASFGVQDAELQGHDFHFTASIDRRSPFRRSRVSSRPLRMTAATCRVLRTSSRGFAFKSTMSAIFPFWTVPSVASIPRKRAGLRVADWMASSGVIPA